MKSANYLLTVVAICAGTSVIPCFADDSSASTAATSNGASAPACPQQEISNGPLLEQRKQLMEEIKKAKAQGVGIAGYMSAFQSLEEQVKSGTPAEQLTGRIDSIKRGLADQLKRSQILKVQKPAPPQGSQLGGSGSAPSGSSGGGAATTGGTAGGESGALEKLRQKFGGDLSNIPDDQIPPNLRDKLKDPAIRQKLMDKFGIGGN